VQAMVPSYRRTGNAGVVRQLVQGADLAIANLENPVINNPSWHLSGTVFSGVPKELKMFTDAGIDWVTIANNHIMDYGATGMAQTMANLKKYGIPYGGAGKGIAAAGKISYLQANGTRVAIIACVKVGGAAQASGTNGWGALPCADQYVLPRIQEAHQHADFVIVFPHWGPTEYVRDPQPQQLQLAQDWAAGGADLIIGSHPHWFGGLDQIGDTSVIYSMGNFIFDQYWSTNTMESAIPEMTFEGNRLVQIRLHPDIILDQCQPNFLNPATDDGKVLMAAIRAASPNWK
jgi:poly-gamma-glutamate capsule biosynthesis protein CapA/YwtB (metallophosphatase superfamily)